MHTELQCGDPWYQELEKKYGYDFCILAGYFPESKPFTQKYADHFSLPEGKRVIQFSGAFHPFHDGHKFLVDKAINLVTMNGFYSYDQVAVIIHADHYGYYSTKGYYPTDERSSILNNYIKDNHLINGIEYYLIDEDELWDSCSRNFTRLYSELNERNKSVHFLCGGDRANYSLTFVDKGSFIVSGRTNDPKFWMYKKLFSNPMEYHNYYNIFYNEDHPASSTEIRNSYNKTI